MSKDTIVIPDLGGVESVTVLEILVKPGEQVAQEAPIISVESDKASMEIPAPHAGCVDEILVSVGQKVAEGDPFMVMTAQEAATEKSGTASSLAATAPAPQAQVSAQPAAAQVSTHLAADQEFSSGKGGKQASVYASPGVRRLAHELGLDLAGIRGTGEKGRVSKEDLLAVIKAKMQAGSGPVWAPLTEDVARFGPFTAKPLNKIKQATAKHMMRCWATIPQVTQCDSVDISELEAFRQAHKNRLAAQGVRLTMLAFIVKALCDTFTRHPHLNAVYDQDNQTLKVKNYYDIGIAVDTPEGLVVPAIRGCDKLSVAEIATALQAVSQKARDGALLPKDMLGAGCTISSLGGIGGEYFTPIVNGPQVAIIGVSKARIRPEWDGVGFQPKLMMPLSLSYDHRVIDGAEAMRFLVDFGKVLHTMHETNLVEGIQSDT